MSRKTLATPDTCSVAKKWNRDNFATCYDRDALLYIIQGYNTAHPENPIEYPDSSSVQDLWDIIESKMYDQYKCETEWCWIEQRFIQSLHYDVQKKLKYDVFLPLSPNGKYAWLSSLDILNIMKQFEKKFDDFKFYGPYPRDFQNFLHIYSEMNGFNLKNELLKGYKRIGFIFNLDKQSGPGTHWTALFINLKDLPYSIEYFDSVGNLEEVSGGKSGKKKKNGGGRDDKVPTEFKKFMLDCVCDLETNAGALSIGKHSIRNCNLPVHKFMDIIKGKVALNLDSVLEVKFNDVQHQRKNSECGVYSVNFIVERLNGKSFEDIVNNIVPDEEMNKKRKVYFRPRTVRTRL